MCTVTYLPLSKSSFLLTHNRDEHFTRSVALLPEIKLVHNTEVMFPKDEQGGGTWFAANRDFTLCLLNGGFVKHIHQPPYKHSRGLIILDFLAFKNVETFRKHYSFENLEPFTLIIIEHTPQQVHEMVWDGQELFYTSKENSVPHIWSSTTLYNETDRERRKAWFAEWNLTQQNYTQENIIQFHKRKEDHEENEGIMINRDATLFTVSLSSLVKNDDNVLTLWYEDFVDHKTKSLVL